MNAVAKIDESTTTDEEETILHIDDTQDIKHIQPYHMEGKTHGKTFKATIDTGSSTTIFPFAEIQRILK